MERAQSARALIQKNVLLARSVLSSLQLSHHRTPRSARRTHHVLHDGLHRGCQSRDSKDGRRPAGRFPHRNHSHRYIRHAPHGPLRESALCHRSLHGRERIYRVHGRAGTWVFLAGVLFVLLTLFRLRRWVVEAIPNSLRYSYAVGIGLFLTFIGLNQTGIVTLGSPGAPVRAGHLTSPSVALAILGFLLMAVLTIRRFPAGILASVLVTTLL